MRSQGLRHLALAAAVVLAGCEASPTAPLSPGDLRLDATPSTVTVTYSDFSDLSDFQLNGVTPSINPASMGGQAVLRLTNNLSQSGSAFLSDPIALEDGSGFQASFSTAFTFQMSNPNGIGDGDGTGADGIAFLVQTVSNSAGGSGGGIGYQGIPKSLAIEFDTYNNGSWDDFSNNHVGINLGGNIDSAVQTTVTPRFNNGAIWDAWVDYDGDAQLLEVRVSETPARPAAALLSHTVDLPALLAQPEAYVGFTSGTGAGSNYHDIRSWQFTNTLAPIEEINEPPVADAGDDQQVESAGPGGTEVTLDGSGSSDPDGTIASWDWTDANGDPVASGESPTITLGEGSHTLTLTVTDNEGATDTDEVVIDVVDTTAPTLGFDLQVTEIWPPNHKMVTVATGISAADFGGGAASISITVTSNETLNGTGDGNTEVDWLVIDNGDGTFDVQVRAERNGDGSARIYTIVVEATDGSGNVTTATGEVTVLHDQGKKK